MIRKREDATKETGVARHLVKRDQENVMPQKSREENVSRKGSLVVSKPADRLSKMKTRNQLVDVASLKCSGVLLESGGIKT